MTRAQQMRLLGLWYRLNVLGGWGRPARLALRRFLTPPAPRINAKQGAFLATARSSTLRVDAHRVALYEWGSPDAPYVYTAYGYGYNAGRWRHFAPQLVAGGYRVVAYDYPGHGRSSPTLVDYPLIVRTQRAVLEHFGRPALALAHSFGAGTFVEVAADLTPALRPRRVALLAPFSDAYYIFRQYADALGFGERHFAALCTAIEQRTGRSVYDFDVAARASVLGELPALIVHDPADEVTAFRNAERLHAHWPGSYLRSAGGAGHGIRDAATSEAIVAWLLHGELPPEAMRSPAPDDLARALSHPLARCFRPLEQVEAYADRGGAYYR